MAKVRTLILRAPGTNCDIETAFAFARAGAEVVEAHVNQLIRGERRIADFQIVVIPGGFTYGDDIGAGKVLANELRLKLGDDLGGFIHQGGLMLGICNGFQVMVKAGILPGFVVDRSLLLTLWNNDSGRFECRWVHLGVNRGSPCVFTRGMDSLYLPIAHGEGKVITIPGALPELHTALFYTDEKGTKTSCYPDNPNGSQDGIAGICDVTGRIFALMPHPERHIRATQHPRWTRMGSGLGYGDGFGIFKNAVAWASHV